MVRIINRIAEEDRQAHERGKSTLIEQTLAIIKPDAVAANFADEIITRIEAEGFHIRLSRKERLSKEEARVFYQVHEGKSFFEPLVEFMSSGSIVALLLERENAIDGLRDLIGSTDPKEAREGTIRADFAASKERNAIHASDSPESAAIEIPFFFSKLEALRAEA
jgi:nucleoside-diphosphate kinase